MVSNPRWEEDFFLHVSASLSVPFSCVSVLSTRKNVSPPPWVRPIKKKNSPGKILGKEEERTATHFH
jgi:hypothetical protein